MIEVVLSPVQWKPARGSHCLFAAATVWVALLTAGCNLPLPGKPNPKDRPIPAEKVLAFDALYDRNCAGCHGKDGKQGPAPPLNDPLFRAIIPVAELESVLEHGRPGTAMVPFARASGGPLNPAQIQVLVHEIKGVPYRIVEKSVNGQVQIELVANEQGIAPQWGKVAGAAADVPPYLIPDASGNEAQGAKVFGRACASCHGENGEGVVQNGKRAKTIHDPVFLSLISDQAIRRIIITGRPDLKMPNYSEKAERPDDFQPLTSNDVADLGALLSSWRKGVPPK